MTNRDRIAAALTEPPFEPNYLRDEPPNRMLGLLSPSPFEPTAPVTNATLPEPRPTRNATMGAWGFLDLFHCVP